MEKLIEPSITNAYLQRIKSTAQMRSKTRKMSNATVKKGDAIALIKRYLTPSATLIPPEKGGGIPRTIRGNT